jgi:hypothetical protein
MPGKERLPTTQRALTMNCVDAASTCNTHVGNSKVTQNHEC